MSRKTLGTIALWGVLASGSLNPAAHAQGWLASRLGIGMECGCAPPPAYTAAPVYTAAISCAPPPPQFTQVPVTEVHQMRQTVQRPRVEVNYVDQPVTEYRPVTEMKTAQVPTMQYQTVTEYQTRQRDAGQWVTQYQCRPQVSPCEYDSRPGLLGWMNRNAYSTRMAFTPKVVAQRTYCPNVITESIPVTRQVAIPGTRQVAYQVTRMVPYTTTRKVAVNTVRMVAEEVVTNHHVTVMKTIQTGGASAYAYGPIYGGATTAVVPSPDPVSSARAPTTIPPRREANARNNNSTTAPRTNALSPDADAFPQPAAEPAGNGTPAHRSSLTQPEADTFEDPANFEQGLNRSSFEGPSAQNEQVRSLPSAIRVTQWVARRPAAEPARPEVEISVAESSAPRRN